jgi:hypothetical protein
MSKLRITLTDGAKDFVEDQAARSECTPDQFVQLLLEDFEKSMQRHKLNDMLLAGYRQLRGGLGRVMTDAAWERLERRIDRKAARAKK